MLKIVTNLIDELILIYRIMLDSVHVLLFFVVIYAPPAVLLHDY